jgi:hypothetical protein
VRLLFDLLSSCSGLLKHTAATTPAAVTVPTLRLPPGPPSSVSVAWTPHDHLERRGVSLRFADGYSFGDRAISGGIIASNRQLELSSAEPNVSRRSDKDGQSR